MFMFDCTARRALFLAAAVTGSLWGQCFAQSPDLGQVVTASELRNIDFTVMPDGRGLPPGAGNAQEGKSLFQRHCKSCHGEEGSGGTNDQLVGGIGTLNTAAPVRTIGSYWPYATTLFDYLRRAMPYNAPGSLTHSEVYALVAYLLHLNGIVDQTHYLDAQSLPEIEMPNVRGFDWAEYKWLNTTSGGEMGEKNE